MLVLADISGRQGGIRHRDGAARLWSAHLGGGTLHFRWRRWLDTTNFDALETSLYVERDGA
jgi:hypothetical protein